MAIQTDMDLQNRLMYFNFTRSDGDMGQERDKDGVGVRSTGDIRLGSVSSRFGLSLLVRAGPVHASPVWPGLVQRLAVESECCVFFGWRWRVMSNRT